MKMTPTEREWFRTYDDRVEQRDEPVAAARYATVTVFGDDPSRQPAALDGSPSGDG